jgi:hypothetical protein
MKAEMDAKGRLTITAETGVESFALGTWWKAYGAGFQGLTDRKPTEIYVTLQVVTDLPDKTTGHTAPAAEDASG